MAISTLTQTFKIGTIVSPPGSGTTWETGTTQTARKIGEQNLPADYTLTEIQVGCKSIRGATGANPAIIRVYQYGRESSAAMIEISSVGQFTQPINLVISARYGADRKVIVDAWDPDPTSPNNTCSLTGTVAVAGRPYFTTGGGVTQNLS